MLGTPVPRIPVVPPRSPGLTAAAPEALVREPGRSRLFALPGTPMRSMAAGEGRGGKKRVGWRRGGALRSRDPAASLMTPVMSVYIFFSRPGAVLSPPPAGHTRVSAAVTSAPACPAPSAVTDTCGRAGGAGPKQTNTAGATGVAHSVNGQRTRTLPARPRAAEAAARG